MHEVVAQLTDILAAVPELAWLITASVVFLTLAIVVRRIRRAGKSARVLTGLATFVGLAWSAEGMWETTVNTYRVVPTLAAVLFFLFEAMIVSRMLRAEEYRHDRPRRARFVRSVWLIACVMGGIVALGEGISQAPLRLAVPLGVAYVWWLDLTAGDDPADRGQTSWRWTPRRLGLALGLLEPGARDVQTVDRDRLIRRMTLIKFRRRTGTPLMNDILRRGDRLARLALDADDEILAEVDRRIRRSLSVLVLPDDEQESAPTEEKPAPAPLPQPAPEVHPVIPPQPHRPERVTPVEKPRGWHRNPEGMWLRGPELRADAVRHYAAGMSNADLAALYTPPLGQRVAEEIGASLRRQVNGQLNGAVVR